MFTIHFWNVETILDPWDHAEVTITSVDKSSSAWSDPETETVLRWKLAKAAKASGQSAGVPIHPAVAAKITHYSIGESGERLPMLTRVPKGTVMPKGTYYGNPKSDDCSTLTAIVGHDERTVKLAPAIDRTTLRDGRIVPKLMLNLRLVALSATQAGLALDQDTLALLASIDAEDAEDAETED